MSGYVALLSAIRAKLFHVQSSDETSSCVAERRTGPKQKNNGGSTTSANRLAQSGTVGHF
eukprot:m.1290 g.1290  ORF g.1290 m.1290 type:complete len:60 (+) comp1533_c0_seq1:1-180(+)